MRRGSVGPRIVLVCLLKLYIYGYLNRVQSSRSSRERGRPQSRGDVADRTARAGSQTIADFRKDKWSRDQEGLRTICRVVPEDGPAGEGSVAIDGSKFKAVNSRDNNFTQGKIQRRQKQIEESVARYMSQLDTADPPDCAGRRAVGNGCCGARRCFRKSWAKP